MNGGAGAMKADYDRIAPTYDRRYVDNAYPGTEAALRAFVGEAVRRRVLEVGCGTGHWLKLLGGAIAGVDGSAGMLARAREHAPRAVLVHARAEHLPLAAGAFDRVYCINALHHFVDKLAFMREARRVLRDDGHLMTIGLDPHSGVDRWFIYDYFEPVRDLDRLRYTPTAEIAEVMRTAGLRDCVVQVVEHVRRRWPAAVAIREGRLHRHATSQLSLLTDDQYERGLAQIQSEASKADARGDTLYLDVDLRLHGTIGRR